ncbi:MAG: arylsulfatase [Planctomycetota bacterium]|jgi:arylsulfatase
MRDVGGAAAARTRWGWSVAAVCAPAAWAISALAGARADAAPERPPNVMVILADDMGFSDAGCYGGEIETPNLDRLAAGGLRFSQHYSTARCWPSRATILTGYYAQQIRRDGMPGIRRGNRPGWAPLLPAYLKGRGYRSYHSGKWHIDGAPTAGGFDRSWGRHKGGCDWDRFFSSAPWKEGRFSAPVKKGEQYYSTVAIADHAIACLKLHEEERADEPFFQYVAFYSPHFPLHAMQKDIDRFRDSYREGWDAVRARRLERMKGMGIVNCALSDRQPGIWPSWNLKPAQLEKVYGKGEAGRAVAWDELTEEQKKFQATKMAIHAAMVYRMDAEIGRIIDQLKAMGQYENTLIMFAADNGASAEHLNRGDKHHRDAPLGSAKSYVCLGPGWSTAANTPFRLHKHWNHEGGILSPFIVHWPDGIAARGELRHDPSHFIDIVPTVLEVAGVGWPDTWKGAPRPPTPGLSLVPAFAKDGAVKHESLWWCHQGNRAVRMGDWKLVAHSASRKWELYDLARDRSEMKNLVKERPEVVKRLDAEWNRTADHFRKWLGQGGKGAKGRRR